MRGKERGERSNAQRERWGITIRECSEGKRRRDKKGNIDKKNKVRGISNNNKKGISNK